MDKNGKIKYSKSKNVDFAFVYEVKNRELQGISLIGYELLNRGYTIGYVNTWHGLVHDDIKYNAKVAIVFEAYNTKVVEFALSFLNHCDSIFNMQWEQILNEECLQENSIFILNGKAKNVYHAAWGEANYNHLNDICCIPQNKIKLVGHVGLDFAREPLNKIYLDKKILFKKYGLDLSKRVVLFISSFADPRFFDKNFGEYSVKCQQTIIEWLLKYSDDNPDTYVIYRPHPTEIPALDLQRRLKKKHNIIINKECSVQQWIGVSDVILNWWSTSFGDIYASKRQCVFLRPYEMPTPYEYFALKNARFATTYEEMIKQIAMNEPSIPINDLKKYYYIDEGELAYIKIVRELEKIYKYDGEIRYDNKKVLKFKDKGIIRELRENYGYFKSYINMKLGKANGYEEIDYHMKMSAQYFASEKKIAKLIRKIKRILNA